MDSSRGYVYLVASLAGGGGIMFQVSATYFQLLPSWTMTLVVDKVLVASVGRPGADLPDRLGVQHPRLGDRQHQITDFLLHKPIEELADFARADDRLRSALRSCRRCSHHRREFLLRRFGGAHFAPTIQFLATSNSMLTLLRMA